MNVYISFIHRSPVKQEPAPWFTLRNLARRGSHPAEALVKGIVSPHTSNEVWGDGRPAEDCGEDCGGCFHCDG